MTGQCATAYLPLAGPSLALIYDAVSWIFLASFGEFSWFCPRRMTAILIRSAVLGASVAVGVGLCEKDGPIPNVSIPIAIVFLLISLYFIRQTRRDITGPAPKLEPGCMKDKIVLVTGANTGIGKDTVRQLVGLGAKVILACRSEAKALSAMNDIRKTFVRNENTQLIQGGQLLFIPLDLSNFESVRKGAKAFHDLNLPLHVLINNAGVMRNGKQITNDGYEICLQSNHLGHFLFTLLLLPDLLKTKGRIINLTSITYKMTKGFDFDDPNCEHTRKYTMFSQYAMSKACNILFTKELVRRYPTLSSYAVNPGVVRTDVVRNMVAILRYGHEIFGFVMRWLQKTPEEGAYTSVLLAGSEIPMEPNGSFLSNCQVEKENEYVKNANEAKRVWDWSEKQVGIDSNK